ncbi:immunoglobulin domain-containing protein, partial [Runella limosa]|uniref:immunoglobulin domain-containing protein n=1 Tax=Runella limosa TaxID=370978 RepID=UPI001B7FE604
GTLLQANSLTYTPSDVQSTTTYLVKAKNQTNGCTSSTTSITITVNNPTSPTIGAEPTLICPGNPSILSTSSTCNGVFIWSPSGGVVSSDTKTYTVTPTATTTYTVKCQENGCLSVASNSIKITVKASETASAQDKSRCGNGVVNLTASGCSSGYNWFGTPTSTTPLATASTYTTSALTQTTTYYVECTGGTASCPNPRIAVKAIINTTEPPVIAGNSPRFVCPDSAATLTVSGCTGNPSWGYTLNTGGSGTLALTTTSISINYASLSADTTSYKVTCQTPCGATLSSNTIKVVRKSACTLPTVGGTIAGSTTTCSGTNSTILTLSGHTGTITKWQYSTSSSFSNPVDIANTTTTYTANNLTQTTYYRAVIQASSGGVVYSSVASINVTTAPASPVSQGDKIACTTPYPALTVSIANGESVDWFTSASGGTKIATGTSFTPNTFGTYYAEAINPTSQCKSTSRTSVTLTSTSVDISSITLVQPTCSTTTGSAAIISTGTDLQYSKDNISWQSTNTFSGLLPGTYTFYVRKTSATSCIAISNSQTLLGSNAPVLTTIPNQSIVLGTSFNPVTATVTNGILVNYQWFNNNGTNNPTLTPLSGETSATLGNLPTVIGTYNYKVIATSQTDNSCSSSQIVTLSISPSSCITIKTQPSDRVICNVGSGASATFSVSATGTALTYQWQKNGTNILWATSSTYSFIPTTADHDAKFRCIVKSSSCTTSITSEEANLRVYSTSYAPQTICTNGPTTLTAPVLGHGITYQWYRTTGNVSSPISGANTATYSITPTAA